jgi:predicted permease
MIQKIKKFIVVGIVGLTLMAPGLVPILGGVAAADIVTNLCDGANSAGGTAGSGCGSQGSGDAGTGLKALATKIVNAFSIVVGAVAVIMIIYGGFRYITSGGDSGRVGTAKNTLIYAIVGLIIVALAQLIVHYVINSATNSATSVQ